MSFHRVNAKNVFYETKKSRSVDTAILDEKY